MTEYGRIHTDGSRSGGQPVIKTQHCPNCEATEQKLHDFRQEVSDAVEAYLKWSDECFIAKWDGFDRFIIPKPKPDPLHECLEDALARNGEDLSEHTERFRAALEARGLEIREKNDDQ